MQVSSYEFEDFELDLRRYELRRNGRVLKLEKIPMELLILLVSSNGDLVSREEIIEKLWGKDVFVETEHSINTAVRKIRQALGDDPENPRFVKTLKGKGYRFEGAIKFRPERAVASDSIEQGRTPAASPYQNNAPNSHLIGQKVSHYRVLEVLGAGGMGIVYKAEDMKLGRRVALKFLPEEMASDPRALERFEREALAISGLDHPNICTIYEVEEHAGRPFLVMQYLEGQTLRERLESQVNKSACFRNEELLDIALQITSGLEAAHQKGMIHRDIKPANIFLTGRGEAKILDFGLAKFIESSELADVSTRQDPPGGSPVAEPAMRLSITVSRTGVTMGTPAYLSPEQVTGEKLDARTDVYSLGLILYEMATGHRAIAGVTATEVREAILETTLRPVRELNPEISPGLEEIIHRAISKDPEARYRDASEMHQDLLRLRSGAPKVRSRRWTVGAAASAIVLLCAAAGLYSLGRHEISNLSLRAVPTISGPADTARQTTPLLIKGTGPKVFFVVAGRRRWIPDNKTLDVAGFDWTAVKTISDKQLYDIPEGEDYPSLPGRLVKGNGPDIYLLVAGKRRQIPDDLTLRILGLRPDDVQTISDEDVRSIPVGQQITQDEAIDMRTEGPKGTFLKSCKDEVVHGNILTANCQKLDGTWQATTLQDFSQCEGDIWNVAGYLSCTYQRYSSESPDPDLDPTGFYSHLLLAENLERKGAYGAAIAEYKVAMDIAKPPQSLCSQLWLAHAYVGSGDVATARTILQKELSRSPQGPPSYCMAQAYAELDKNEAIRWLKRAQLEHDPRMHFAKDDWRLASLRGDDKFEGLALLSGPSQ